MTEETARAEDDTAQPQQAAAKPATSAPSDPAQPDPVAVAIELRDRLLRTLADMDNLRKRTDREVADSRAYGISSFARDIVGVADNMRRALDAVAPELRAARGAGVKALIDGVELTERELLKALEKNGVRQFTPQGEKFDPNLHQAMYRSARCIGARRQRRPGRAAGLYDRRTGVAAGIGRGVEGRPEDGAGQ